MENINLAAKGVVKMFYRRNSKHESYTKILNGSRLWSKGTLLKQIVTELNIYGLPLVLKGNEVTLYEGEYRVAVEFGSSNYADQDKAELIASLYLEKNGHYQTWESLFNICKDYYGKKYRALTIHKDEAWEGSDIQKECKEVYAPLFKMMQDLERLEMIKRGESFTLTGKKICLWPVNL